MTDHDRRVIVRAAFLLSPLWVRLVWTAVKFVAPILLDLLIEWLAGQVEAKGPVATVDLLAARPPDPDRRLGGALARAQLDVGAGRD